VTTGSRLAAAPGLVRLRDAVRTRLHHRHFAPGRVPLSIPELVSPLRYDVVVRAEHFAWHAERQDLFAADFRGYEREACTTAYHTWFTEVALVRYHPHRVSDLASREAAFRDRLRRSARLFDSFATSGFDARFPVALRTAGAGATSSTGKQVTRPFHVGDGCHRLALLVMAGETVLAPELYRVHREPLPRLIDNTSRLIPRLGLDPADYYRYLSSGYVSTTATDRETLLSLVATERPERLAELQQVLSVDERVLDGSTGRAGDRA